MMKSNERVIASLNHKQPDKIPVDLGGTHDSTLNITVHKAIAEYYGQTWDDYNLYDWMNGMVVPDERLLETLNVDTRSIYPGKGKYSDLQEYYTDIQIKPLTDGSLAHYDENGNMTHRKPKGGISFQETYFPLRDKEIDKVMADSFYSEVDTDELYRRFKGLSNDARQLKENSKYAVVQSQVMGMVVTPLQLTMGYEDWFVNLACNPLQLVYLTEKYLENQVLPTLDIYFREIGEHIDVAYCIGDDLADQRGPMFDPVLYKKYFKPMHKRIIETVKKHTEAKIIFHMCGSASQFIGDLIDVGVDAVNPVQTHADGMSPVMLKNEFGNDISFWGGLDTQKILTFGTEEEIRDEVKYVCETLGKNGGFIFAPCHDIQQGTPVKNLIAMFDELQKLYKK